MPPLPRRWMTGVEVKSHGSTHSNSFAALLIHLAQMKHARQQLLDPLKQHRACAGSPSFKSISILGSLIFPCRIGTFRRRQNAGAQTNASVCAPAAKLVECDESGILDIAGSSPTAAAAAHQSHLPASAAQPPKSLIKRNRVILSDSSGDDDGPAAVDAREKLVGEHGGDDDSVDLLDFSDSESSEDALSDDDGFINDESSSSCSSSSHETKQKRSPVVLQKKRPQLPPCARCLAKDGDRFRCSECHRTYHEVCGGPGPSCTLCSECAAALGVDPEQIPSSSDSDGSPSSSSSSASSTCSGSSDSSNAEYECAACHESDTCYIRACRACGVRSHEYCGGPGPLHRNCDRYTQPHPPPHRPHPFSAHSNLLQLHAAKEKEASQARLGQGA